MVKRVRLGSVRTRNNTKLVHTSIIFHLLPHIIIVLHSVMLVICFSCYYLPTSFLVKAWRCVTPCSLRSKRSLDAFTLFSNSASAAAS